MPNIKSNEKRVITSQKAAEAHKSEKTALKTAIKTVTAAVEAQDKEAAQKAYSDLTSLLDKAVSGGIYSKNAASRQKSRLAKAINAMP
jgi:small subunit ribosomal protein S20